MAALLNNRLGFANAYDATLRNINARQAKLSQLQENLTSGKRVVRASDDPTSAAIAERALNRLSRITTDQRTLASQVNSITQAESTLGDVSDAMQRFRELVVQAGNASNGALERRAIAQELKGLRDQIFAYANRTDTNGQPLFGALASALAPLVGPATTAPDYSFNGMPGTDPGSTVTIPFTLDGEAAFMHQPARDLAFNVGVTNTTDGYIDTSRTLTTSAVTLQGPDPAASLATVAATAQAAALDLTDNEPYPKYTLTFGPVTPDPTNPTYGPSTVSYTITETPNVSAPGLTSPYTPATPITFTPGQQNQIVINDIPGLTFTITGSPKENDVITIDAQPSTFSVLDDAISGIGEAINNNAATQAVTQALHNLDIGMGRINAVRAQAGELLNRAERISANQEKRSIQQEADRSRAEDLDMVKGISDFQNQQTGYQAALQSYAQIQKLSLFNYIG
ncbi:MAG: flagellar hook-associated protein FlgL [Rhodoferax sp.]